MPDIFMHFIFRRWFSRKAPSPGPAAEAQPAPQPPPRPS